MEFFGDTKEFLKKGTESLVKVDRVSVEAESTLREIRLLVVEARLILIAFRKALGVSDIKE